MERYLGTYLKDMIRNPILYSFGFLYYSPLQYIGSMLANLASPSTLPTLLFDSLEEDHEVIGGMHVVERIVLQQSYHMILL